MSMRSKVAIVGVGRTPYTRQKPGDPVLTVDEYIAWAADLVPNLTNVIDASVATHQPSRITPSEQETPS